MVYQYNQHAVEQDEVQMKLINETNKLLWMAIVFVVAPEDRQLRSGDENQFGIGFSFC